MKCSAIIMISAFAFATHAFAAAACGLKIGSGYQLIRVGQQQSGQPLKLHGVFEGFDAATRRLKLEHLDQIDFAWENAMRAVEVDDSVSMNALEPGMTVTATLKRKSNGRYYVSGLERK